MIPEKENPFPFKILRVTLQAEQRIIGIIFLDEPQINIDSILQYYNAQNMNRTAHEIFETDYYKIGIFGLDTWNGYSVYTAGYYLHPKHF